MYGHENYHIRIFGIIIYIPNQRHFFKKYASALEFGKEAILRTIRRKAVLHGIEGEPKIDLQVEDYRIGHQAKGLLLEIVLTATATE